LISFFKERKKKKTCLWWRLETVWNAFFFGCYIQNPHNENARKKERRNKKEKEKSIALASGKRHFLKVVCVCV
jgi:hypothetical protein